MTNNRKGSEFSEATRRHLAMRAGFRCSMPTCRALTAGPSDESPSSVTDVGVAAHINSAAKGRRYAPNMPPEVRKDIRNGIWLCATHSIEIDRDEAKYTANILRQMKDEHERFIADELNAGRGCFPRSDLVAIGPNIVGVGELLGTAGKDWSIRIDHFVEGDLRALIDFSERFDSIDPYDRYLLDNTLGEGRQLANGPAWRRAGSSIELNCTVEQRFQRVDVRKLGQTMATNAANDLFVKDGNVAMVSGLDSLPQRIKNALSMLQGESPVHPKAGSRLKEYFDAFENSPWLQRWVKLEVVRLACIPYYDRVQQKVYPLVPSVLQVLGVEQIPPERTAQWQDFRFKLDVQGVGVWEHVIAIFVPQGARPLQPPGWEQFRIE